jgi:hypothetical protein
MGLAVAIGVVSAIGGLYASYWIDAASGATIVLVQTGLFLAALALGPRTGLFSRRRTPARRTPLTAGPDSAFGSASDGDGEA